MGLLDKVDAIGDRDGHAISDDMRGVILDFCHDNPSFHCIVLRHGGGPRDLSAKVTEMTDCHGAVCGDLSDRNCIVLLPGGLDMELFSHRISKSTGSTVAFQFSADSPSAAFETLQSYLP